MLKLFNRKMGDPGKPSYEFDEPENTACFICDHVFSKTRPILYAVHGEDGDWQFLCGENDHGDESIRLISLLQVIERDGTVNALHGMHRGVCAERTAVGDEWVQRGHGDQAWD